MAKQMKTVGTSRTIIWRKAGMMNNVQSLSTGFVKRYLTGWGKGLTECRDQPKVLLLIVSN